MNKKVEDFKDIRILNILGKYKSLWSSTGSKIEYQFNLQSSRSNIYENVLSKKRCIQNQLNHL